MASNINQHVHIHTGYISSKFSQNYWTSVSEFKENHDNVDFNIDICMKDPVENIIISWLKRTIILAKIKIKYNTQSFSLQVSYSSVDLNMLHTSLYM